LIPDVLCEKTPPPTTIEGLFFRLDKRLALIEAAHAEHCKTHTDIDKPLDDHEAHLPFGLTLAGILTGSGGLFALIALIESLFSL